MKSYLKFKEMVSFNFNFRLFAWYDYNCIVSRHQAKMQRNWNENVSKNPISQGLSKPKSNSHCYTHIHFRYEDLKSSFRTHRSQSISAFSKSIPTHWNEILHAKVEPPMLPKIKNRGTTFAWLLRPLIT